MGIVATFSRAKGAREITVEDMKLALAEVSRRLPIVTPLSIRGPHRTTLHSARRTLPRGRRPIPLSA